MRRGRTIGLVVATLLALEAGAAEIGELWRSGDASLEVSGTVRGIVRGSKGTSAGAFHGALSKCSSPATFLGCPAFDEVGKTDVWIGLTRLRTRTDLRITPRWSAAIAYDLELLAGQLDTLEASFADGLQPDSLFRADGAFIDTDRVDFTHRLYRGYVRFESKRVEATLGRQRIPWGVGRLWNPIDRFNAIGPLAVEGDQSPGVDALDIRWLFSGFTFLEVVAAPLHDPADGSYAARLHGVWRDVDYSLVGGVFEEAPTLGFDLAGNVGGAAARMEIVYADPRRVVWRIGAPFPEAVEDYWQVVLSVDYLFDVGSGVYALVEHLYNGNALGFGTGGAGGLLPFFEQTARCPAPLLPPCVTFASDAILGGSRVASLASHLTGVQFGYDLTPEVRTELLVIFDWTGSSASYLPSATYSPFGWLELSLGAQIFAGSPQSEFGDTDPLFYLIAEAFF